MAKTFEEALEQQAVFLDSKPPRDWRHHSLNDDYEFKSMLDHGTGLYSVHKETQQVCECKMEWFHNGMILMCPVCFLEGT